MKRTDWKAQNIRTLAILLVVLGHSIIIYDPNWNLYQPNFSSEFFMYLKRLINIIQMPLFFALSGYCYGLSTWRENSNVIGFAKKKAKRLLIPFCFFALFWVIPIRSISHYALWDGLPFGSILLKVFLGFDSGHLWFLPTLFVAFILISFLEQIKQKYVGKKGITSRHFENTFLFLSFLLSFGSSFLPELLFIRPTGKNLFWFYFGLSILRNQSKERQKKILWVVITIVLLLFRVFYQRNIPLLSSFIDYLGAALAVMNVFEWMPNKKNEFIAFIASCSFGIYLFHSPLLYPIFCYLNFLKPWQMCILNFFGLGGVSLFFTCILRKSKYLRILIGE